MNSTTLYLHENIRATLIFLEFVQIFYVQYYTITRSELVESSKVKISQLNTYHYTVIGIREHFQDMQSKPEH